MWKQMETQQDITQLMSECHSFHDCCLHNIQYTSGASVDEDGYMTPINSSRTLTLEFHQQGTPPRSLRLNFQGLDTLFLSPTLPDLTCELLEAHLVLQDGKVLWMSEDLNVPIIEQRLYVCAKRLEWEVRIHGKQTRQGDD